MNRVIAILLLTLIGPTSFLSSAHAASNTNNWFFSLNNFENNHIVGFIGEKIPLTAHIFNLSNQKGSTGTDLQYGGLGFTQNPGQYNLESNITQTAGAPPGEYTIKPNAKNAQPYNVGTLDLAGFGEGTYTEDVSASAFAVDTSSALQFDDVPFNMIVQVVKNKAEKDRIIANTFTASPTPTPNSSTAIPPNSVLSTAETEISSNSIDSSHVPAAHEQIAKIATESIRKSFSHRINIALLISVNILFILISSLSYLIMRRFPTALRVGVSLGIGLVFFITGTVYSQHFVASTIIITAVDASSGELLTKSRLYTNACIVKTCSLNTINSFNGYLPLNIKKASSYAEIVLTAPQYQLASLIHNSLTADGNHLKKWEDFTMPALFKDPQVLTVSFNKLPSYIQTQAGNYSLNKEGGNWGASLKVGNKKILLGSVIPKQSSLIDLTKDPSLISQLAFDQSSINIPYPKLIPTTWHLVDPENISTHTDIKYTYDYSEPLTTYRENIVPETNAANDPNLSNDSLDNTTFNLQPDASSYSVPREVLVKSSGYAGNCQLGQGILQQDNLYYIVPRLASCQLYEYQKTKPLFLKRDLYQEFEPVQTMTGSFLSDSLSESDKDRITTYQISN